MKHMWTKMLAALLAGVGAVLAAAPSGTAALPPLTPVSNVTTQWARNVPGLLNNAAYVSDTDGAANVGYHLITPGGTTKLDEYRLYHMPAITVSIAAGMVEYNAKQTSSRATLAFWVYDDKVARWKGPFNAPVDQSWGNYNTQSFTLAWDASLSDAYATLAKLQAHGRAPSGGAVLMDECFVHLMPRP